jgi:hypothetical protein
VAAETGVFGVVAFFFLVAVAFSAAYRTMKSLNRLARHLPEASSRSNRELQVLRLYSTALLASLAGWFVCALFASIAYNWTFYYLLGLCAVTRDLARPLIEAAPAHRRERAGASTGSTPAWARG